MSNTFQVEPGLLRSAAGSVEECCRQLESGRKSGAAAAVSSGMAGFAVAGACEAAGEASVAAFSGVAKSWRAWSGAADRGAADYTQVDVDSKTAIRSAAAELVV